MGSYGFGHNFTKKFNWRTINHSFWREFQGLKDKLKIGNSQNRPIWGGWAGGTPLNVSNYLVTKIQVDRSKIGRDILRARASARAQYFRNMGYIVKKGHFRAFSAKKMGKILNSVIILHNIIFHNNWRPREDYILFTEPFFSVF